MFVARVRPFSDNETRRGGDMRYIRNLIDRRKVWKELPSYPVYSPPFHDAENVLAKREIKANYDYFLEQKALRIEYLAEYLASFSIALRLDLDGMKVLDGWLFRYGGHLLPWNWQLKTDFVIQALHDHEPAWTGAFQGLNVINDIGILVGDYIIARNPDVHWDVNYGNGTKRDYERIGFGKPCLYGLGHMLSGEPYPILGTAEIYNYCDTVWSRLRGNSQNFWHQGELVRRLDYLVDKHSSTE